MVVCIVKVRLIGALSSVSSVPLGYRGEIEDQLMVLRGDVRALLDDKAEGRAQRPSFLSVDGKRYLHLIDAQPASLGVLAGELES